MYRVAFQVFLLFLSFLLATRESHASEAPLEYQIKAASVLNAARFIGWPPTAFNDPHAPIVIGILGENPFGSLLQNITRNETVQRRRIIVRLVTVAEAANCHIVFVGRSQREQLAETLSVLNNSSVLTIGEGDHFAESGGVMGLALEDGKVRFEINLETARRACLKIDPRLLNLARIVK